MNLQEWRNATCPDEMLLFLSGSVSCRKMRLFACACCRRIPVLTDAHRHVLELAESYADGRGGISKKKLKSVVRSELLSRHEVHSVEREADLAVALAAAVQMDEPHGFHDISSAMRSARHAALTRIAYDYPHHYERLTTDTEWQQERAAQANLVRDLFSNLVVATHVISNRITTSLAVFADAIYTHKLFSAMPIFADALEEADCVDDCVLVHCRAESEHVRGCWVIDMILGHR